jgi:hypothetical protein
MKIPYFVMLSAAFGDNNCIMDVLNYFRDNETMQLVIVLLYHKLHEGICDYFLLISNLIT